MSYTMWCVLGTIVYYLSSSLVAYALLKLPSFDSEIGFIQNFYFRGTKVYDTDFVSVSKFVYFWAMNAIGFTFVNIVNC